MKKYSLFSILVVVFLLGITGMVQADLNDGLIAYYPFNGNVDDESGNVNNGTEYGISYELGKVGQAAEFDGIGDYIGLPSINYAPTSGFTWSAWVKSDHPSSSQTIFSYMDSESNEDIRLSLNDGWYSTTGTFHFLVDHDDDDTRTNNSCASWTSQCQICDNQWYHVIGVMDYHDNIISIFVDGQLRDQKEWIGGIPIGRTMNGEIGGMFPSSSRDSGKYFFNGLIDELRIYDRALSESEIQCLYTGSGCESPIPYTQAELDAQYEAGKQYCIKNPEACGIEIGGDAQVAYDEGHSDAVAKVKADPSAYGFYKSCDSCCSSDDGTDNCATLESNFDITMPCIDVFGTRLSIGLERFTYPEDPFGYYWKLLLE